MHWSCPWKRSKKRSGHAFGTSRPLGMYVQVTQSPQRVTKWALLNHDFYLFASCRSRRTLNTASPASDSLAYLLPRVVKATV